MGAHTNCPKLNVKHDGAMWRADVHFKGKTYPCGRHLKREAARAATRRWRDMLLGNEPKPVHPHRRARDA